MNDAPEDAPDGLEGFYDPLWNLGQIIVWVETRSPYVVDALSDSTPEMASRHHSVPPSIPHYAVDFAKAASKARGVEYYPSPLAGETEEVMLEVLRSFQSGALVASGQRNGSCDNDELSKLAWGGVIIGESATGEICVLRRGENFPVWTNIRVDRAQVLKNFPPPPLPRQPRVSSTDMASEYRRRIKELQTKNEPSSRPEDEAWCEQMGYGREAARELRRKFAPQEWQKPGRPKKTTTKE